MGPVASQGPNNPRTVFLDTQGNLQTLRAFQGSSRDPEGRSFVFVAQALLAEGSLDEAKVVLDEGLKAHPSLSGAHLLMASVLEASGDLSGARQASAALQALDPENQALPALTARLAQAKGEEEKGPSSEVVRSVTEPQPESESQAGHEPVAHEPAHEPGHEPVAAAPATEVSTQDLNFFDPFAVASPSPGRATPVQSAPKAEAASAELPSQGGVPQTRTLAELYASQGHTARAIAVYEVLLAQNPRDPALALRLAALRGEARTSEGSNVASGSFEASSLASETRAASSMAPFEGIAGLEDFALWLDALPVLPEALQRSSTAGSGTTEASMTGGGS